jgi:hypothetical protein
MKTARGSVGEGSIAWTGCARFEREWLRVVRRGLTGANTPFGVYGRGLNDWAAGVKKLRSGVSERRCLRGREIALVDGEPAKDREAARRGRDSDITV